ncbi:hypothetical protein P4O66_022057 [Electrophorus voltai]|uniref:Ubiquitin-like protease family profile domain-containing protein n=1 Tax=Electrophorus voltai TaxID=2609070 RepID=A0AAD8ZN66_9TELE|nr:hypothetical protein P4O66_022057 [Electrophorus voltai]
MGTPFKIPKKRNHPSHSSRIHMTSPLSRVQDGVTSNASWTSSFNGRKPQERSRVNGKQDASPGSTGADRWRPKRASDTLCSHEGDKEHPLAPAVKKRWGSVLADSQSEEEEETQPIPLATDTKQLCAAVGRGQAVGSLRATSPKTWIVGRMQDKQQPRPSTAPDVEAPVPKKPVGAPGDKAAPSMPVRKASSDRCFPTVVLSSDDDEEDGEEDGQRNGPDGARTLPNRDMEKPSQNSCAGGQRPASTEAPSVMELPFSTLHFGTTQTYANGPIVITEDSILIPLKGSVGKGEVAVTMVPSKLHSYGLWDGALVRDGTLLAESREPSPSLLFLAVSYAQARLLQEALSSIHTTHTLGKPCPFVLVVLTDQLDDLQRAMLASLMDVMGLRCGQSSLAAPLPWDEGLRRLRCNPRGTHLLTLLGHGDHACSPDSQHTDRKGTTEESLCKSKKGSAGHKGGASEVTDMRHASLRSHTRQQSLPRRLIQYPPPPSKGGITVTTEDLECLRDGEFLNDVIIDFYLKYLHLERADRGVADRVHIFSSFFYKQLTRKSNSSEEEAGGTAQYRRHRRVKNWTRHVDIFSKDYLFIPVNQEAHWYLVVICFPGLQKPESVPYRCSTSTDGSGAEDKLQAQNPSRPGGPSGGFTAGKRQIGSMGDPKGRFTPGVRTSHDLPDCTVLTCQRKVVTRRPCILTMDSLKLSYHYGIYPLLREYLQVEWEVRRKTPRAFNDEVIKGCHCKVPLQDNSSDCGLYLLQYVESFLQNPVVHFELPLRLERWFPRQQIRRKRGEIRELVLQLYRQQGGGAELSSS